MLLRLFVAVDPPPEIKTAIHAVQADLKPHGPGVSWTRGEGFHCTLQFLGEVDAVRLEPIRAALGRISPPATFALYVRQVGVFPNWFNPRVIWIGLEPARPELAQLREAVEDALRPLGFPPEDRPFHPHLTLGRVKDRRNLAALADRVRGREDLFECGAFTVGQFTLFQSTLRPSGAEYNALQHFALRGQP